ncbi:hypothetical protein [Xenococcus sp. PCC 7305]|uniref:hypothetical protein n=1 Tax=Xenococcus sp. PCC 7305 TaxID=102125 RepID=UPI0002F335C4|nr:hypothetical protein [Xenococcus sp. PCC 7305]
MKNKLFKGSQLFLAASISAIAIANLSSPVNSQSDNATVIALTQTGCQFVETEAQNYNYQTTSAADCKKINGDTLAEREKEFKPLELAAGEYVFQVTNENVPYELGFFLRGQGISRATLPTTSGGGLTAGTTKEYKVTLRPGKYWISCPLNPTPDYPLIVN